MLIPQQLLFPVKYDGKKNKLKYALIFIEDTSHIDKKMSLN